MRSVSTWNCALMSAPPFVVDAPRSCVRARERRSARGHRPWVIHRRPSSRRRRPPHRLWGFGPQRAAAPVVAAGMAVRLCGAGRATAPPDQVDTDPEADPPEEGREGRAARYAEQLLHRVLACGARAAAPSIRAWPSSSTRLDPRPTAVGGHTWSATPASRSSTTSRARSASPPWLRGRPLRHPRGALRAVVAAGARPTPARDLLRALQASGLRLQKRRGDKGVARVRGSPLRRRHDRRRRPHRVRPRGRRARVFAAMAFVRDAGVTSPSSSRSDVASGGPPAGGGNRESRCARTLFARFARRLGWSSTASHSGHAATNGSMVVLTGGLWQRGPRPAAGLPGHVPGRRPPRPALDDTSDHRWMTWAELEARCSDAVLVGARAAAALSPRAG